ncbi:MAG: hypothetical protein U0269_29965 [Polyangiales bacterium]
MSVSPFSKLSAIPSRSVSVHGPVVTFPSVRGLASVRVDPSEVNVGGSSHASSALAQSDERSSPTSGR